MLPSLQMNTEGCSYQQILAISSFFSFPFVPPPHFWREEEYLCGWKKPEYVTPSMPLWHKKILNWRQLRNSKCKKSSLYPPRPLSGDRILSAQRQNQRNLQTNLTPLVSSHRFIFPWFAALGSLKSLSFLYHFSTNVLFSTEDVKQAGVLSHHFELLSIKSCALHTLTSCLSLANLFGKSPSWKPKMGRSKVLPTLYGQARVMCPAALYQRWVEGGWAAVTFTGVPSKWEEWIHTTLPSSRTHSVTWTCREVIMTWQRLNGLLWHCEVEWGLRVKSQLTPNPKPVTLITMRCASLSDRLLVFSPVCMAGGKCPRGQCRPKIP